MGGTNSNLDKVVGLLTSWRLTNTLRTVLETRRKYQIFEILISNYSIYSYLGLFLVLVYFFCGWHFLSSIPILCLLGHWNGDN